MEVFYISRGINNGEAAGSLTGAARGDTALKGTDAAGFTVKSLHLKMDDPGDVGAKYRHGGFSPVV